jgi:hypothetical protein
MAKYKTKLRAGVGAKCSICTRFLHPRQIEFTYQKDHRTNVVLVSADRVKIRGRMIDCYHCTVGGDEEDLLYAARSHFKLEENGPEEGYFIPLTEKEKEEERQAITSANFKEAKIKWKKSEAKRKLYLLILDGEIADTDTDSEDLSKIYLMDEEFAKYDFGLFKQRLSALRQKVHELNDRAKNDLEAFETYKSNHKPSLFSHKGYIQWQGSTSQELLLLDIENGKHKQISPKDLWASRSEYYDEFPLDAFRSKLYQELSTAKYLHTLKERGLNKKGKKTKT